MKVARLGVAGLLLVGLGLSPLADAAGGSTLEELKALTELEVLDRQIGELEAQVTTLQQQVDEAEAAERAHQAELTSSEAALSEHRVSTGARLRAIYRLQRRGMARLLFSAESPGELRTRAHYLYALIEADQRRVSAYRQALVAHGDTSARVAAERERATTARDTLAQRKLEMEAERTRKVAWLKQLRSEQGVSLAREREVATAAFDAQVRAMPTPDTAADSDGGTARFVAKKGRLAAPVEGTVIRGYGRYVDRDGTSLASTGLDFSAAPMTPFRAVSDGEVVRAGYVKPHGQTVIVQHGSYVTVYAHANGLQVAQGEWVQAGQILGSVGTTGLTESSDGQLHFEVRKNGVPEDPASWLARSALRCARDVDLCR